MVPQYNLLKTKSKGWIVCCSPKFPADLFFLWRPVVLRIGTPVSCICRPLSLCPFLACSPTSLSVSDTAHNLLFSLLSEFCTAASPTLKKYPTMILMMRQMKEGSPLMLLNHIENHLHCLGRDGGGMCFLINQKVDSKLGHLCLSSRFDTLICVIWGNYFTSLTSILYL